MVACRPHYFKDIYGENVECEKCGFVRHKTLIDTQLDFAKVTGSPYLEPDDFYKKYMGGNTGQTPYTITWGTGSNSTTFKLRPEDLTFKTGTDGYNQVTLTGTVV